MDLRRKTPLLLLILLQLLIVPPFEAYAQQYSFPYAGPISDGFPPDIPFTLPVLKPIPVQAAMNPYLFGPGDDTIDLVLGKPMAVMVNVSGASDSIWNLTVEFDGQIVTRMKSDKNVNDTLFFQPFTPRTEGPNTVYLRNGEQAELNTTNVNSKKTNNTSITYFRFERSQYGIVSNYNYSLMKQSTNSLIAATYPVNDSKAFDAANQTGARNTKSEGMKKDAATAHALALAHQEGYCVGVALVPDGYFAYHGYPGAAGVSFGPNYKGVIVLDGYYSGGAHEIGHTLGLYWTTLEQYQLEPPYGYKPGGVDVKGNYTRYAYDIMGAGDFRNSNYNWINTTTYVDIFNKTRITAVDPTILYVNGAIYKNGTFTHDLPWYVLEGTPDTVVPGSYSLKLFKGGMETSEISFAAWFGMCLDPVGPLAAGLGYVGTDFAAFSFTIPYPSGNASAKAAPFSTEENRIEVWDKTDPRNPRLLYTMPEEELLEYPTAEAGGNMTTADKCVLLTANGSTGDNLKYRWDFNGDGTPETDWLTKPVITHCFSSAGIYTVILEVTDGYLIQMDHAQVTVLPTPPTEWVTSAMLITAILLAVVLIASMLYYLYVRHA